MISFDNLDVKSCAVTTTTTGTTTTTTTTTTSTSTTTTTTPVCGPDAPLATASPDITRLSQALFGTFPPGWYLVRYTRGALSYDGPHVLGQNDLYLNRSATRGYKIVSGGNADMEGPMTDYAGYPSESQVQSHNAGASVSFYHSGGRIGMYLHDAEPNFLNHHADVPPVFTLASACFSTASTGTTTGTTTTSTTTTSTTTTTVTTTSTTTTVTTSVSTITTTTPTTTTPTTTVPTTTTTTTTTSTTSTTTTTPGPCACVPVGYVPSCNYPTDINPDPENCIPGTYNIAKDPSCGTEGSHWPQPCQPCIDDVWALGVSDTASGWTSAALIACLAWPHSYLTNTDAAQCPSHPNTRVTFATTFNFYGRTFQLAFVQHHCEDNSYCVYDIYDIVRIS